MRRDEKGLTAFELLLSISIGSIAIMILMSILSVTIFSKNEAEYRNRLYDEVFYINEHLRTSFDRDLGYSSIEEFETANEHYHIFILVDEYDIDFDEGFIIGPDEGFERTVFLLWLDTSEETNGLYYFEYTGELEPEDLDMETLETARTGQRSLGYENTVFTAASAIEKVPLKDFDRDSLELYKCQHAYITLDFELTVRLSSGETLPPRRHVSTLFY